MYFEYEEQIRDRDAFDYDNFISKYQTTVEANLMQKLLPKDANVILDAGCGTGRFIDLLMQKYINPDFPVIYHGIDLSEKSLKVAKQKLKTYNEKIKYILTKGSVTHLPFDSEQYDLILCSQVFEHIIDETDQLKTMSEFYRCLKPGGTLLLTTFCYSIFDVIRKTPKIHTAFDGKVPNYIKLTRQELLSKILPKTMSKNEIKQSFGGLCLYRIPGIKRIYKFIPKIIISLETFLVSLPFSFHLLSSVLLKESTMLCRYKLHETKRQRKRIGSTPADCGKAAGKQGHLRDSQAGRGFSLFGTPMERSSEQRWSGCSESQATSGTPMSPVQPTEKTVTENPSKRATCRWLRYRLMDLSASGRGNPAKLRGEIPSRPCLAPVAFAGLELPKTRAQGPRTRRSGHPTLATARLAAYKKKPITNGIASFLSMKLALCCSRYVAGHGPLKAKRLFNTTGIATTVSRSSLLSVSRRNGGVWGFTLISIPTISALSKWRYSSRRSAGTWAEGLFWFWTVIAFTAKRFVCLGKNTRIGSRWSGFLRMLRSLIL